MLSSIDMILDATSDIITIGKTIRTTYTVTTNTNQMSITNQVNILFQLNSFK